jgi:hypothetical protein
MRIRFFLHVCVDASCEDDGNAGPCRWNNGRTWRSEQAHVAVVLVTGLIPQTITLRYGRFLR